MWKFNLSAVRGPLSVGKSMIFVDRGHDHFGHRTPDTGQRTTDKNFLPSFSVRQVRSSSAFQPHPSLFLPFLRTLLQKTV
jgi:hypothetical protein